MLDCTALMRLWAGAVAVGLIDLRTTKAVAEPDQWPTDDEGWVEMGVLITHALFHVAESLHVESPLVPLLLDADGRQGRPIKKAVLAEWWWRDMENPVNAREDADDDAFMADVMRSFSDDSLASCLVFFGDLGLWEARGGYLIGTEFGWDNAMILGEEHDPHGLE